MKVTIISLIIFSFFSFASIASDLDIVTTTIIETKPVDWKIINNTEKCPYWACSDNKCVEMEIYGTALGKYKYYNSSGIKIAERSFHHESITLWITPKDYKSGWNFFTLLLNRINPKGTIFPEYIGQYNGVKVYGKETYYADSEKVNEDSPKGTVSAIFSPPSSGRRWQEWRDDIRKAIQESEVK